MPLQAGAFVWIPCSVLRSPFADERYIWLESPDGPWSGYVNPQFLRDDIAEGRTAIRATVVAVSEREISARLPGHTLRTRLFRSPARGLQVADLS